MMLSRLYNEGYGESKKLNHFHAAAIIDQRSQTGKVQLIHPDNNEIADLFNHTLIKTQAHEVQEEGLE